MISSSQLLLCQAIGGGAFIAIAIFFLRAGASRVDALLLASPAFLAPVVPIFGMERALYLVDVLAPLVVARSIRLRYKSARMVRYSALYGSICALLILFFSALLLTSTWIPISAAAFNALRMIAAFGLMVIASAQPWGERQRLECVSALSCVGLVVGGLTILQHNGLVDLNMFRATLGMRDVAIGAGADQSVLGLFRFSQGMLSCYCAIPVLAISCFSGARRIIAIAAYLAGLTSLSLIGSETSLYALLTCGVFAGCVWAGIGRVKRWETVVIGVALLLCAFLAKTYVITLLGDAGVAHKARAIEDQGFGFNRLYVFEEALAILRASPEILLGDIRPLRSYVSPNDLSVTAVGSFHNEYLDLPFRGGILVIVMYGIAIGLLWIYVIRIRLRAPKIARLGTLLLIAGMMHGVSGTFFMPAYLFAIPVTMFAVMIGILFGAERQLAYQADGSIGSSRFKYAK